MLALNPVWRRIVPVLSFLFWLGTICTFVATVFIGTSPGQHRSAWQWVELELAVSVCIAVVAFLLDDLSAIYVDNGELVVRSPVLVRRASLDEGAFDVECNTGDSAADVVYRGRSADLTIVTTSFSYSRAIALGKELGAALQLPVRIDPIVLERAAQWSPTTSVLGLWPWIVAALFFAASLVYFLR